MKERPIGRPSAAPRAPQTALGPLRRNVSRPAPMRSRRSRARSNRAVQSGVTCQTCPQIEQNLRRVVPMLPKVCRVLPPCSIRVA